MPITNVASKFLTESVDLTTTDLTTVYTVPANHSCIVRTLLVANTDASNRNVDISWYHAEDDTTKSILENYQVGGSSFSAIFTDQVRLYLHQNDIIKVQAGTANTLVVTICSEEFFDPAR